jgi:hypothetical protein
MKTASRSRPLAGLLLALAVASSPSLAADRVELRDGSVIFGTVTDADSGTVTLETEYAGTLSLDYANIASMQVESDLTLQMDDGQVLETSGLALAEDALQLPAGTSGEYALSNLTRINPEPWELGDGYDWNGGASGAFARQRGNTETDELSYRIESNWESLKDRYRTELYGEVNEANGVKNAENWTARARYDRVQTGDWYWGGGLTLEQDKFADLDLRSRIGPYAGRKFFTEPVFELEAESGLAYISEDFISAEDRDYIGATWDVHIRSNWLGGDSQIYYLHSGILNLDDLENVVLKNTLGLSFPLFMNIEGAAELVMDINTGAPTGTEKLDETYRFRIGYSW